MSGSAAGGMVERLWRPGWPVNLRTTLSVLQHGSTDPVIRLSPSGFWRTSMTPDGSGLQRITVNANTREVTCQAWGDGAQWLADSLPALLGADDDPEGFDASLHPLVADMWRRHGAGFRVPRSQRVAESLIPAIIEQRVTGLEARRAWAWLLRRYGSPHPGPAETPAGMLVPPTSEGWRRIPSWDWHRAGVERARSDTIMRALALGDRLEAIDASTAEAVLTSVRGIGRWTVAEVGFRALGDADAVSFGDFHLGRVVVHALTGETVPRGPEADTRMAEVLEPWAGHRQRVVRMVELSGLIPQRRGPRYSPLDHRNR